MSATLLASFPNSRIKPRPATAQSATDIITIPSGIATLIAPANVNRTELLLRNLSNNVDLYYGYNNSVDGTVGPSGGMLLKAFDSAKIVDPGNIYVFQSSGGSINIAIDEGEG